MARGKGGRNAEILEYALHHLERERDEIQARIDHIRQQLGGRAVNAAPAGNAGETPGRRVLSAAARKRIAAAQKRRWAAHRREKAKTA